MNMADEPNKRMEEMLKAYADKRRQDPAASVELHPATRQMLQAEVARTYKHLPPASLVQRILTVWPRVAFSAACLVVTLTLVFIVLPRKPATQMAQRKLVEEELLARDSRLTDKEKSDSTLNALLDAPAPTTSTAPVTPPLASVDRLAKQNESDEFKTKSEVLAERRVDAGRLKLKREEAEKPVARQAYTDTLRARYAEPAKDAQLSLLQSQTATQAILSNFEFEQIGDQVRLIDGDGSVYSGKLVSQDSDKAGARQYFRQQKNAPAGAAPQSAAAAGPAEQTGLFYAYGTNRSLKQQVSIEANILQMPTNAVGAVGGAFDAKQNQRSAGSSQQLIRGSARVGTNREVLININAVPAQP